MHYTTKYKIAAFAVLALGLMSPALAQFQPTPSNPSFRPTYRASVVGLVTAASATDIVAISGSATKTVQITRAECNGTSATGAVTSDITAIKRSTANTGGTSTTPTAVPMDSSSAAATAVVRAYTVNPTVGTPVGTVASAKIPLPAPTTAGDLSRVALANYAPPAQPVTLRGVAQVWAINGNGATLGAGAVSLDCVVEWVEF